MIRACCLFGILILARAQVPNLGFCPDYVPMADFDIENFLGKWYEAERYFQFTKVASRCVVTDYARGPSGKIYVSNEVTNSLTGVKRIVEGHLEPSARSGEGKFNIKYNTSPISSQASILVLSTDYDNYAVLWSCSGFGPIHTQSVWAMTRERLPAHPVLQRIYGILDEFKISRNFFIKSDQEGCALAASDINAANGITSVSTIVEATGLPQRNKPTSIKDSELEKVKSVDDDLNSLGVNLDTGRITDPGTNSHQGSTYVHQKLEASKSATSDASPTTVPIVNQHKLNEYLELRQDNPIPEATPQDVSIHQVIRTIPFASEPVKIEIENPVISLTSDVQDIVKTVVTVPETEVQPEILTENEVKAVKVAEILLQKNPQQSEINNDALKTKSVPIIEATHVASSPNVPFVSIIASDNVPMSEIVEVIEKDIIPMKLQ